MSNCFLVADEVGLGKTIIAQHVAKGIFENENGLRMVYIASNNRIARQNMADFLPENTKNPKPFQKAAINRALISFYGKNYKHDVKIQLNNPHIIECDRISKYMQMQPQNSNWKVMILSPKTSFYCGDGDIYDGEQRENKYLKEKVSEILGTLEVLKNQNVDPIEMKTFYKGDCNNNGFRLLFSFWYEYHLQNRKESYLIKDIKECADSILEALNSEKIKVDNKEFLFIRRVVSNVAFLDYNPNLIALDEFQRFRKVLNSKETDHYSVKHLLDFIKCFNSMVSNNSAENKKSLQLPKILLLSATPYAYDMSSIVLGEDKGESVNCEDPFSSFEDLKACIKELGGSIEDIKSFISRTERNMFMEQVKDIFETKYSEIDLNEHLEYIQSVYEAGPQKADKQDDAVDIVDAVIEHTPHFWIDKIQDGYEGKMGTKISFKDESMLINPTSHAKFQSVIRYVLPENIENHLWLPPASEYNTEIRKGLVFSKYKMTDRLIPIVINDSFRSKFNNCSKPIDDIDKDELKIKLAELLGIKEEKIIKWLVEYLSTDNAKDVIIQVKKGYSIENIIDYCSCYKLKEVIDEYMYCNSMQKNGSVFDYDIEKNFACGYIEEDLSKKDQKDETARKQTLFNSPFYPFVMTVTETAQEGIDLHCYCDQIIHWSVPSSASAFIQREGRIDRPNSLIIRKRIQQWTQNCKNISISDYEERKNVICQKELKDSYRQAKEAGILPDWYIPICDETNEMSPRIRRIMCGTFLSGEMERDEKMLYAANNYNQFLDGESRKSLCSFFGYKA